MKIDEIKDDSTNHALEMIYKHLNINYSDLII